MESNLKPMDDEMPTICQEKKEELLISDSDDEIQMWVEKPVVIDLTCSYDENTLDCSHAEVVEMESNATDPKVIEIKIDNDVGNLGSCSLQDSVNASTLLQDFINMATSTSCSLRVRTVESLNQDLLKSHAAPLRSTGTSPVNSATSSGDGTATSQSEPKDDTRLAIKKRSMSISSERIDGENHSKKIRLKSCDRFYDATALRDNPKKKYDDRRISAKSINPKSDSFNSERNQQGTRSRRRSRFTYENSHHSRNHSSLVYPGNTSSTSTHLHAKTCEEDSHSSQMSSSAKSKTNAWTDEDNNAASQKSKHSQLSENQRSSRSSVDDHFHTSDNSRRSRFRSRSPIHQRDTVENGKTSKGYRSRYSSEDKRSSSQNVLHLSPSNTNSNNATRMNKYSGASEIQRSPRTRDNIHWESISLTKDRCRPLTSTLKGFNFLNNVYGTYGIKMNLTWSQNITLHIRGTKLQRTRFRDDLAMFIDNEVVNNGIELSASASNGSDLQSLAFNRFDPNLPRSKDRLIKKIEHNLDLLQTYLGNAEALFVDITTNENKQTKISMKQANRSRKDLNIILMGQAGLRDGPKHLAEIKRLLKTLKNIDGDVINKAFIATITLHFNYIFSSYQHDNYPALIAEYKKSLKTNFSTNGPTEASNSSDGPAQVPANMPNEGAHQTATSDSTEASNSSDGPAQVPANIPIEGAHQAVTSDSTEALNSSDGPAQVPVNIPIEGTHQTATSDSTEASNKIYGPAQVPVNMPIESAHQTVTSDSTEASNSSDGPAQVPANIPIEGAHQAVTSDSTEALNSSDGPAQVPVNIPIEGTHQTATSDSTEASNKIYGPAQVPVNIPIESAHQTVTSDSTAASNSSDGPAQVPVNICVEGAHETVTSDSTEASNNLSGPAQVPANMPIECAHRTTTNYTIDSSTQPSIEGAQQVVAGN
ncbi:uncharacterized protein LOC119070015 isoform X2 [Bradysia coprophila]|uniref:uncharacterized protein LOC119070015 isoform X2 n=1 Tax=Bradysia coprophila TaxID=38358 RepID=UPI00187DBB88|nr:uncharacterized protein LOC119070015 isoform X2 [Bradysia coprophila]